MPILLLAEHDNRALKESTLRALTAALLVGDEVEVLVAGTACPGVAEAASRLSGVTKVLLADNPAYEHMLAEPLAALIASLAPRYDAIIAAATHGREELLAPRRGSPGRNADLGDHEGSCAGYV